MTNPFLEHVEVVDDDTDEQVEGEESAANDKDDEIKIGPQIGLVRRLQIDAPNINRIGHDFHPTLESRLRHTRTRSVSRFNGDYHHHNHHSGKGINSNLREENSRERRTT